MTYLGFNQRLVLTPLTDRCYVALADSFRNACIPFLYGSEGSGKKGYISELAYYLGADYYTKDCGTFDCIDSLYGSLQAAISCGLWISYENAHKFVKWYDPHIINL